MGEPLTLVYMVILGIEPKGIWIPEKVWEEAAAERKRLLLDPRFSNPTDDVGRRGRALLLLAEARAPKKFEEYVGAASALREVEL